MAKKNLILVGGGGHCKACIDVINAGKKYATDMVLDKDKDSLLPGLVKKYKEVLITIGSLKDPSVRIAKFNAIKKMGARFAVIVSPLAYVAKDAALGEGTIVMHGAIVNAQAKIGVNCIINTGSIIEHEAVIGDHTHISTGSIINGQCRIGSRVFIGSQAVVLNNVDIADDVVIGAGAVVHRSITKTGTYAGVPAVHKGTLARAKDKQ